MLTYLCRYYLSALDSNDTECTKEGEVFNYQGEDKGQAYQGKPSNLVASLNPNFTLHVLSMFTKLHAFILILLLNSNCWRLGSTSQILPSLWMAPFHHLLISWISGLMVSIMAFGKTCSGAKTLGWEHSNETLKNDFKNLGMECYSIDGFQQ
jgi:hypothetical protein